MFMQHNDHVCKAYIYSREYARTSSTKGMPLISYYVQADLQYYKEQLVSL